MKEPSERQRFFLALIVHEYVRTAAPVGSRYLVEHYNLDMSSATVRNELAALTEMGYLRQPHTSAGRVPTEEGYRYFVGRLLQETGLPDTAPHHHPPVLPDAQRRRAVDAPGGFGAGAPIARRPRWSPRRTLR